MDVQSGDKIVRQLLEVELGDHPYKGQIKTIENIGSPSKPGQGLLYKAGEKVIVYAELAPNGTIQDTGNS